MSKTRTMSQLVTVRHIVPVESFPEAQAALVEQMAQAIVTLGASVRPLFVRPAGFDAKALEMRYEVIGDHLAYWAASRARELDPVTHEMTTAWVVETPEQQAAALAQVA